MSTLALDLGTSLGWALQGWPEGIKHGTQSFAGGPSERDGVRFLRFRSWLHDMKRRCELFEYPLIQLYYERVDFMVGRQVYAAHVWGGMWATLTAWAEHHGIPYEGIAPGTIKKAVAGNGNASKIAVSLALRKRGFEFGSLDESDAIALLLTAAARREAA